MEDLEKQIIVLHKDKIKEPLGMFYGKMIDKKKSKEFLLCVISFLSDEVKRLDKKHKLTYEKH